ncbi:MAG: Flp pilus assembly protein CpaB [Planctomycetota bacterium]|nr:MAG: Flp pilus assembly protein CpaB [Planctomycetota bacterium]
MRAKSIVLLVMALGCGLVAAISITQVMAKKDAEPTSPSEEMTSIVVAVDNIGMGDAVTKEQVKLEEWPKDKVPEGALTDLAEVEGRRTKTKIYKGSPLLEDQLLEKGAVDAGAAPLIPRGYRVVAVKVDAVSGSAAIIRPSDRVDVVVHFAANPAKGIMKSVTRTILQNIRVFAVDDKYIITPEDDEASAPTTAKTVSLLVKPEQAEMLTAASELGKIRLVLRGLGDEETTSTPGVEPTELLGEKSSEGNSEDEKLPGEEFMNRLLAGQSEPTPQPAPVLPPTPDRWAIRVISGPVVSDVTLEAEEAVSPTGDGEKRWRVVDEYATGGAETGVVSDPFAGGGQVPGVAPETEPEPEPEPEPLIDPEAGD